MMSERSGWTTDENGLTLEEQIALDFAETAVALGHQPMPDDYHEEEMKANRRDKDNARKKEARELARLRKLHRVVRECPVCHRKFFVKLGDVAGNFELQTYDTAKCRETAKKRRARKSKAAVSPSPRPA